MTALTHSKSMEFALERQEELSELYNRVRMELWEAQAHQIPDEDPNERVDRIGRIHVKLCTMGEWLNRIQAVDLTKLNHDNQHPTARTVFRDPLLEIEATISALQEVKETLTGH